VAEKEESFDGEWHLFGIAKFRSAKYFFLPASCLGRLRRKVTFANLDVTGGILQIITPLLLLPWHQLAKDHDKV
jgi:hypothetical protein